MSEKDQSHGRGREPRLVRTETPERQGQGRVSRWRNRVDQKGRGAKGGSSRELDERAIGLNWRLGRDGLRLSRNSDLRGRNDHSPNSLTLYLSGSPACLFCD